MASTGLSRRRVATSTADDDGPSSSSSHPSSNGNGNGHISRTGSILNNESNMKAGGGHAGSAFEGGSRIAFDPRDLEDAAGEEAKTGGRMPKLTIMEEILLLGIKDKQVHILRPRIFKCL